MSDTQDHFNGVLFTREELKCTFSKVIPLDAEEIVKKYTELTHDGYIPSSIVLCEDGTLLMYVEDIDDLQLHKT